MKTLLRILLTRKANRALVLQERQERIELGKKLAGLTDPTFLDRANFYEKINKPNSLKRFSIDVSNAAKVFKKASISIAELNENQERKVTNKKAYNNKRGLIQ